MKKLIFGTDWWTDCDDAVAMRLFARAHLAGKIDLLAEKGTRIWMMAGKWETGCENNFCRNRRSRVGGAYVLEHCPVPITFLGYEVGVSVISDGHLKEGDPLRAVLVDHGSPNGRNSWDPMLAMLAVGWSDLQSDYRVVRGQAFLNAETGENRFVRRSDGLHGYVVKLRPDEDYAAQRLTA